MEYLRSFDMSPRSVQLNLMNKFAHSHGIEHAYVDTEADCIVVGVAWIHHPSMIEGTEIHRCSSMVELRNVLGY